MVLPFQIEASDLRGRVVRLGPALDAILQKHGYPDPVAQLLAETVVIGAALAAMLKYQGKFTLQARGDGPVGLVVADSAADGALRGYAQYDAEAVARMGDEGIGLLGRGHLAFTVEQPDEPGRESYQGIVELRGGSMPRRRIIIFANPSKSRPASSSRRGAGKTAHGAAAAFSCSMCRARRLPMITTMTAAAGR